MKTTAFLICLFSILFLSDKSFSQGEAAVPFLTFPISPSQNAMGSTGTSLLIDDPYGFLLNPAQLGNISKQTNLSYMFYPSRVNLWGINGYTINGNAINVGFNFKDLTGLPISLGMGYATQKLDLDYNFYPGGSETQQYNAFSLGVGINYFVDINIGASCKNIYSSIRPIGIRGLIQNNEAKINLWDFGVLINFPLFRLINENFILDIINEKPIKPFFDISLGYSQSNIGDEIYYVDPAQSDPLPRTARLGYGIATGVDMQFGKSSLRVLGVDFTVDAEDLLLKYKTDADTSFPVIRRDGYQSFIGDINIGRNILQVKGDNNVITHAGVQINFLESLLIKFGQMKGKSPNNRSTNGFEIRSAGLLKFLSSFTDNSVVKFLANHFDLRYYNSNYIVAERLETNIKGLAIYIQNFNSLF